MKKSLVITILAVTVAIIIAYYLISPAFIVEEVQEGTEENSIILSSSNFKPHDHEVEGQALILESEGKKLLRLQDFETINGPNLHIYLSADLEGKDYIDLGDIKGTKGNFNYELDENINLDKYNKVLVWCVPFKILFSYAEIDDEQK